MSTYEDTPILPLEERKVPGAPSRMIEETSWFTSDVMKLYRALFEMLPDALLLVNTRFHIMAANPHAATLFATTGSSLEGMDLRSLLAEPHRMDVASRMLQMHGDTVCACQGSVVNLSGKQIPVSFAINRLALGEDTFFQIVIRDMGEQLSMRDELQKTEAVVEGMNLALRHVIQSVHEERKEMKDELVQQVKEQVLPTLERIAEEDSSDVRQNYKSVIEDQLVDMSDNSTDPLDNILYKLTPREGEVCRLIALGRKTREICELLDLSFETMQTHRKNIRRKLGLIGEKVSLAVFLQQGAPPSRNS